MQDKHPINKSDEWKALDAHLKTKRDVPIKDLFAKNTSRFDDFSLECGDIFYDFSKHNIDAETLSLLMNLAKARGVEGQRDAMLSGEKINNTEDRAVLHTALRGGAKSGLTINDEDVDVFIAALHAQMKTISSNIRSNEAITDVIHIGVGGSDLGPRLVCEALSHFNDGPRMHFISNVDGQSIDQLMQTLSPGNVAVCVASKTFTTLETMKNAWAVRDWMVENLGPVNAMKRFYALTASYEGADSFGIQDDHILPMRDWVGGRYSVWSSIGLPVAIACGYDVFEELLGGAKDADEHFASTPLEANIPVIMAMLGIWYRNFWDYRAHVVLPYMDTLKLLPTYLQQLDMESNGKSVDKDGNLAPVATGPAIFGGQGTDMQHAFMQSLHQGSNIIPCDFIIAKKPSHPHKDFHDALNANALAQAQALAMGQDNKDEPHRQFDGNRPSSTLVLETLNARSIGTLLALYEHKVFVQGAVWGINSFDQWGVELGKVLAKTIISDLHDGAPSRDHDSSTAGLIARLVK
jgi:glucose-6-phosphate isomerase